MSEWIPTDDPLLEDAVEVCSVRDASGRDGVRITAREDTAGFDAFYDALPQHGSIVILDRSEGSIVFEAADVPPKDLRRYAVDALDAIEKTEAARPHLPPEAFGSTRYGQARLFPRFNPGHTDDSRLALGRLLDTIGVPETARAGVDALLDSSPEVRRSARARFVGGTTTSKSLPAPKESFAPVKVTVMAESQSRGQLDTVRAKSAVILRPEVLAKLSPSQRSAAAGLAQLPLASLRGLEAGGLPLVLETHRQAGSARVSAQKLATRTGLPVEAVAGGSVMKLLFAVALLGSAATTGLGVLSLGAIGLFTLPLLGGTLMLAMLAMAAWMGQSWWTDQRLLAHALESHGEAATERQLRTEDPDIARAWDALNEARASLSGSELPSTAASDLRNVLKAAEDELESLNRASVAARKGLSGTRTEDVRNRLAGLDEGDHSRRASLQATLDELLALEQRAEHVIAESQRLESVLTAVSHAIARWETEPEEQAMQGILQATRSARRVSS